MKDLLKTISLRDLFFSLGFVHKPIFRFLNSFFKIFFLFFVCFHFFCLAKVEDKIKGVLLFQQVERSQEKSQQFHKAERVGEEKRRNYQRSFIQDVTKKKAVLKLVQAGDRKDRFRGLAQAEREGEGEKKSRGLVIRFHRWPSFKQRKETAGILRERGLKRTKSIKSFKAQLFEWKEGGLKPSRQAERACFKLKNLSYVRRCSPDHLLSVNSVKSSSKVLSFLRIKNKKSEFLIARSQKRGETEAGFNFECRNCKNQAVKPVAEALDKTLDIRACNLISDKQELMGGQLSDYWAPSFIIGLFPKLMGGQLSDYWAQELIGSDLLREELKKTPAPDMENWIAVFDTRDEGHNIAVKNLISDKGLHAVLPELRGEKIPFLETDSKPRDRRSYKKGEGGYNKALSLYETSYPGDYLFGFKNRAPHYINNSMSWGESQDIYEVFERLSSSTSNTIVVGSSGNDFPKKLDDMQNKASKSYDMVLVGSFSPRGFVSEFSQAGEELSILAPSDKWITSADKGAEYRKFGGTSGAAPLVTGSLAGFEWLSGYHPTAKEAKILLEKTAFPTLHSFEKPRINGAGLLNAYKLGEVAKRLKEKCGDKALSCFKEEILKEETYRFPEDKDLKRDLAQVFPVCSGDKLEELTSLPDCKEKGELFKRLRKSVLLSPSKELLGSLSCLYRSAGFSQNAEVIERLAMSLGSESEVRSSVRAMVLKEKAKRQALSSDSVRLMLGMGGFEEEFKLFKNIDALRIAGTMGERGLPLLEKGFASSKLYLQKEALRLAGKIGERGLPLLEKGFASGKLDLQEVALSSAGLIGERGLPLLEKGFASGERDLQEEALSSAGLIGERGLPLLEKGFASGERDLQEEALSSAGLDRRERILVRKKALPAASCICKRMFCV